jgi:myo-inositol 2-dehydrogenase/D-chiro-inositol 1-dehydrogenase
MGRLRIGYVGAGGFTNRFMYPQLAKHDVELIAVCDLDEAKARRAQQQYGFAHVYTDVRRMCDEQQLDATFCVGGPQVHYAVGMELLERGLPLYVQKSPAPTAAQTREMAELAQRKGVVCHVGFNIRTSAAVARSRLLMAAPEFGRPTLGVVRYGFVTGATIQDAVMDQHCHAVDTVRYLMGEVATVHAMLGSMPGVRHYVVALTFTSGSVGTLNFTSEQGGRDFFYFEVTGEKGHMLISHHFSLRYKQATSPPSLLGPEPEQVFETAVWGGEEPLLWMGYIPDVANYLAAVRGDEPDRSSMASAVGTMEVCEEIYRQLRALGSAP